MGCKYETFLEKVVLICGLALSAPVRLADTALLSCSVLS